MSAEEKGESVFDAKKIDARLKKLHLENESYNKGIDDAIEVAKEYREMKSKHPNDSLEYNFTNLISRLESLKKNTQ